MWKNAEEDRREQPKPQHAEKRIQKGKEKVEPPPELQEKANPTREAKPRRSKESRRRREYQNRIEGNKTQNMKLMPKKRSRTRKAGDKTQGKARKRRTNTPETTESIENRNKQEKAEETMTKRIHMKRKWLTQSGKHSRIRTAVRKDNTTEQEERERTEQRLGEKTLRKAKHVTKLHKQPEGRKQVTKHHKRDR